MTFDPGNRLIAALDVPSRSKADELAGEVAGAADWVKIGLELFVAEGPEMVRAYAGEGRWVMLDLKLHDIPVTVGRAARRAAALGARLLTVHAAGGRAMLEAAVHAVRNGDEGGPERTRILAVTVLTSLEDGDLAEVGIGEPAGELVLRRAQLAMEAGCDGVVASPREVARLRRGAPDDFLIVTPGVRPSGGERGDQKRVMTPAEARAAGADLLVVGRPIRDADDRRAAARAIADEIAAA